MIESPPHRALEGADRVFGTHRDVAVEGNERSKDGRMSWNLAPLSFRHGAETERIRQDAQTPERWSLTASSSHPIPFALMRMLLSFLVLLATTACLSKAPIESTEGTTGRGAGNGVVAPRAELDAVDALERQRQANHEAWKQHGPRLAVEHPGTWVLIAAGTVRGPWSTFDEAWTHASALSPRELHAYLYRPGVDDVETTFLLSPFRSENPHWVQLGRRIRVPWRLTIAAVGNEWSRDGLRVAWGDSEARVLLESLDLTHEHTTRAVASNLFQYDLTLRQEDAKALGLGRFTAPLPAFLKGKDYSCEKVLVRVRIPELEIDSPAVAFVLPSS